MKMVLYIYLFIYFSELYPFYLIFEKRLNLSQV